MGVASADELPPGGTFIDDDQSVHEGYIEAIAAEDVTSGCGAQQYCPDDDVTRGQMAAFLRRAWNIPASATDHFTDDDGDRFEDDINAIAEAGITSGCGGTSFCPDRSVTRGEMAAFIQRAKGLPYVDDDRFTDDDTSRFERDIEAIAADGITTGCNDAGTEFCPEADTTREQMASFLGRALELAPNDPPERPDTVEGAIRTWFGDLYDEAYRVAECESSHNPRAVNHAGGYHGLFQIGEHYHRSAFERVTGESWDDAIYDAYANSQYARHLYDEQGWGPWTCKP